MSTIVTHAHAELWRFRFDRPVGGSRLSSIDVITVDLAAADGIEGMGFSYVLGGDGTVALAAARQLLAHFVAQQPLVHPATTWRAMLHSFNRTGDGPNRIGAAAVDTALWDLHSRRLGVPLALALGGVPRAVPVYGSGGFHAGQSPEEVAEVVRNYIRRKVRGVKIRVAGQPNDRALLRAARDALPADVHLMADANEKADQVRARALARECADVGALFLEEPLPAHDLAGYIDLARNVPVGLAGGEHLQGCVAVMPYLRENALALVQTDLAAGGGLSEALRVAALAEHFGRPVAPHFLPALFVHLAAAAPNVTWLEDLPLFEPLFKDPIGIDADGTMTAPDRPGHGLVWADGAREAFRLPD